MGDATSKEGFFGRAKRKVTDVYQVARFGLWAKLAGAADKKQFIEVNGHRTQVLIGGQGEPLLYLHSSGGETIWLPFHDTWAKEFTVLAPAHPGFAESAGLAQIDSMDDLLFHYLDFFEAMELDRVNLVGTSLGGWLAAEFAIRYPERVKKLVLVDAAGLWVEGAPMADIFAYLNVPDKMRELLFYDPTSFIARAAIPTEPQPDQIALGYRAFTAAARLGWNPYMHNPKLRERLWRIKAPTLIVWGAADRVIPLAHGQAYQAGIKNAQLVTLEQCGHLPMFEQSEEFSRVVLNFLSSGQ